MVWNAISYHERFNLLKIDVNLNSNKYVREILNPTVVPLFQAILGAIFRQNNAAHMLQRLF